MEIKDNMKDINTILKRMKKADYKAGYLKTDVKSFNQEDFNKRIEDEIFQAHLSEIGGAEYGV